MKPWKYQPATTLGLSTVERWSEYPNDCDISRNLFMRLFTKITKRITEFLISVQCTGKENIPLNGPFIIAPNHSSHLDALSLMIALSYLKRGDVYPVAAEDYFFTSRLRTTISIFFLNALPFSRKTDKRPSLERCKRILAEGSALIFFPEGTRSTTGQVQRFQQGISILTAGTNVPVIPAAIQGTFHLWPKNDHFPTRGKVTITFGEPLQFGHCTTCERHKKMITRILETKTKNLMKKGDIL